jgi:hypothetical protein
MRREDDNQSSKQASWPSTAEKLKKKKPSTLQIILPQFPNLQQAKIVPLETCGEGLGTLSHPQIRNSFGNSGNLLCVSCL